jgi:transcriptional regulator GlxA family with amidase domain
MTLAELRSHYMLVEDRDANVAVPPPPEQGSLVTCGGCSEEIDVAMCWCGDSYGRHYAEDAGHMFVPYGCNCYRDDVSMRTIEEHALASIRIPLGLITS